jgi:transcription initiation factor TFIIIB Brf1 subunit/transcription initiation factor TFIIB
MVDEMRAIFESDDDPRLIAEAFQRFFDQTDVEEKICNHTKLDRWIDGRGYCMTCGEIFTDASDLSSTVANCKHGSVHRDDAGILVCCLCGFEIDSLDFQQEWRWYGAADNRSARDPSRCHRQYSAPKGVRTVFESHKIDISPMMANLVEARYQKILQSEGNKVLRGQSRESIVAACLFYIYQEFGEFRTSMHIQELFQIKQKNMSIGMNKYLKAFPEARVSHITPEKLLPWLMKLTDIDRSHYRRILIITRYMSATSELVERSNPQSVAAAIIFFYLCLNQDYKERMGITRANFAKRAKLSEITIIKIVKEISLISRAAISM